MRYCEKCGNKLKEGFLFCDKCGAKVEDKVKEVKEVKKEKVVEEVKEVKKVEEPIYYLPPKKKGKKGIVFLIIMNILLLASTITFLVLWLTKPEKTTKTVNKAKVENKFVGKWEQNIEYQTGKRVVQRIYESIEVKNDNSFRIVSYDKDNIAETKEELSGTYTIDGDKIQITWKDGNKKQSETYELNGNKLCIDSACQNYLLKNGSGNKIVIPIDEAKAIETIDYDQYNKILNSNNDAIVVVVRDGCHWCESFESVVEDLLKDYNTPIYYYQLDNNIDISATPTTIIIKKGQIIDVIEGYKSLSSMESILDNLDID